jgi:voltage-gated potassium channel
MIYRGSRRDHRRSHLVYIQEVQLSLQMERMKQRVHQILEAAPPGDVASRAVNLSIMALIILNVAAVILDTVEILHSRYDTLFRGFELFSVAVFSVEYFLRIWSSTADERFAGSGVRGRLRFMRTPYAIIDLVAILPFYIPFLVVDLRHVRAIRLFRLFKMARYSESMRTLGRVLALKKEELFISLFSLLVLLVFSSSMIYYVENDAQPEAFSSIPAAMWWGVVTLATVGYGDVYPITPAGKLIGALVILVGIGMFALPAGILASGFVEVLDGRRGRERDEGVREVEVEVGAAAICPHCGRRIDEPSPAPAEAGVR